MEFIDKTILAMEAEAIVSDFLNQLKIEGNPYPKDLYGIFKSTKNKEDIALQDLLIDLLLKEQNYYCCYCMRKLDFEDEEKTLEHLIPNKIKSKAKFDTYLNPETVLNDKNVCFSEDFTNNQETNFPPYPHTVAYHNLTVSCNGKISHSDFPIHCNLKRGNEYVKPFILHPKISEEFKYNPDGFVCWEDKDNKKKEEKEKTLNILGLNIDRLRMIRRIWFYAAQKGFNLIEFDGTQRIEFCIRLEKEVFGDETGMLNNFKTNDQYWNLLKKYGYFKLKFLARQLTHLTVTELKDLIENIKLKYASK
jgi:hypothetical protein